MTLPLVVAMTGASGAPFRRWSGRPKQDLEKPDSEKVAAALQAAE